MIRIYQNLARLQRTHVALGDSVRMPALDGARAASNGATKVARRDAPTGRQRHAPSIKTAERNLTISGPRKL
jgi:hypothetical protein